MGRNWLDTVQNILACASNGKINEKFTQNAHILHCKLGGDLAPFMF